MAMEKDINEQEKNVKNMNGGRHNKKTKKRDQIKISTWNVRTMLEPGKIQEITSEMQRYQIDVAAIQEIRWAGQGEINENNYTIQYSGNEKQGLYGVAFITMGKLKNNVIQFNPISERMAYLRIKAQPFNISMINVYAPTESADEEEKNILYERLEQEIEMLPKEDTVLVLGDFNAQVGKEDYIKQIAGKHTLHEKTNNNGQRLCNLAASTNMIISSTKFIHPKYHKVTWISPDQKSWSQIDHILITRRKQTSITDVRTYRGAHADSDHFMVTATLRQKVKRTPRNNTTKYKWNVDRMNDINRRNKYAEDMDKKLKERYKHTNNVETEWNSIKECINETAAEHIGITKNHKEQKWYNEECHNMLKKKMEIRQKWLRTNREELKEEYNKLRKECTRKIRRIKRNWLDEKIKDIEKESKNRNTKIFYKKISEHNKTFKGKINGVKDRQGKVSENDEEFKKIWAEYFKELLTEQDNQESIEITEDEDRFMEDKTEEPTREEVDEIINNSRIGKAPGTDCINMELIKYGGEVFRERLYVLIRTIWNEERMPEEWSKGQIITIHKKGDQQMCNNYRGLTLLNSAYKIISTLIQRRLTAATTNILGQYQCGFTKGKSTIDAIHTVKQIMEKAHEYKIRIELLFVDFQQAFDKVKRSKLMLALADMGIQSKLRRLINMTMSSNMVNIRTQKGETEEFVINKGVRQGDSLSATLFNLALEYVVRKFNKGTLRTREGQIIAYADDIVLITKNRRIMENMLEELITKGEEMGLIINQEKSKIMRFDRKFENKKIKIGVHAFEEVEKFRYLGILLTNNGERDSEIKEKIITTNKVYYANKKLLKNKLLSRKSKMRIYRTIIRPTMMYAAETLSMTKKQEEDLRIIERKILRTILGPLKINKDEYRQRTNHELLTEINEDIVCKIKQQRAKWLGHVWRAGPTMTIYSMLEWMPGGKRRRGRPRSTWLQEVIKDINRAGVRQWKEKTRDRKIWKKIVEKIK